jgi:hypothetical protein
MAKLSVLIGGDDRELQKALKRSQSSLQQFGKQMRAGVTTAAKWGAAVAAAAAAATPALKNGALDQRHRYGNDGNGGQGVSRAHGRSGAGAG